jgi:integrase
VGRGFESLNRHQILLPATSTAKRQAKIEKANAAENTFAVLAAELIEKERREGKAEVTLGKTEWLLSLALPDLGDRPIKDITAPEILAALRKVESRGKLETAKRLRATIGQVFGTRSRPGGLMPIRQAR